LLVNAKAAIAEAFGVALPDDFRLRFIERGADVDLLVVLPEPVEDRLGPEELREIAGGSAGAAWLGQAYEDT
jgi:hypothetical protein